MFKLEIDTVAAAFHDPYEQDHETARRREIARILEAVAETVYETRKVEGAILDYNGNAVGKWRLTHGRSTKY